MFLLLSWNPTTMAGRLQQGRGSWGGLMNLSCLFLLSPLHTMFLPCWSSSAMLLTLLSGGGSEWQQRVYLQSLYPMVLPRSPVWACWSWVCVSCLLCFVLLHYFHCHSLGGFWHWNGSFMGGGCAGVLASPVLQSPSWFWGGATEATHSAWGLLAGFH